MRRCQNCGMSAEASLGMAEPICNAAGLVGGHSFVEVDWYDEVARVYEENYGEPLVADATWVHPLWEMCGAAVGGDPALEPSFDGGYVETVERTAAVIAVMTHGTRAVTAC